MNFKYRVKNSLFDQAVDDFKSDLIAGYLREAKGNVLEVSRKTGLSRNTIYKILKKTEVGGKVNGKKSLS